MDKPWFRKLFPRSREHSPAAPKTRGEADAGDAEAQFQLGLEFANGADTAPDFQQAAQWYRKAADQNHAPAHFNLGTLYAKGQGVPRDDTQAVSWFHKAAEQGNAQAQFSLGIRLYRAATKARLVGVSEMTVEAYMWLRLSANQGCEGSAEACQCLTLAMTREEVADGNRRLASNRIPPLDHAPAHS